MHMYIYIYPIYFISCQDQRLLKGFGHILKRTNYKTQLIYLINLSKDRVNSFGMNRDLAAHLIKKDESVQNPLNDYSFMKDFSSNE